MKTIVVPTDFSENSVHALKFAAELNKKFNAEIILFHTYLIPVDASNILMPPTDEDEIKKAALRTLRKIKEDLVSENILMKSDMEVHAVNGYLEGELKEFVYSKKADLVIMGTRGAGGLKEKFIGSNAANALDNVNCPVIVVPKETRIKELNKIVYAANFSENDFVYVYATIEIAKQFNAELIILHITGGGDVSIPFQYNLIETFTQSLKSESKYEKINFKLLPDKNVEEGIDFYLEEINADLLVMAKQNRSIFKKLFEKNLSRKMAMHSKIPLMVYQADL